LSLPISIFGSERVHMKNNSHIPNESDDQDLEILNEDTIENQMIVIDNSSFTGKINNCFNDPVSIDSTDCSAPTIHSSTEPGGSIMSRYPENLPVDIPTSHQNDEIGKINRNRAPLKSFGLPIFSNPKLIVSERNSIEEVKMRRLTDEIMHISKEIQHGNHSIRADLPSFEGDDLVILQQINNILDYIVVPSITASFIERILKGKLSPKIPGSNDGECNEIVTKHNSCIDTLSYHLKDICRSKKEINKQIKMTLNSGNKKILKENEKNFGWNVLCGLPETEDQQNQIEEESVRSWVGPVPLPEYQRKLPKEDIGWSRLCGLPDSTSHI